jgi:hypothetical protein
MVHKVGLDTDDLIIKTTYEVRISPSFTHIEAIELTLCAL